MDALITKLSDTDVLIALAIAFFIGFWLRGNGRDKQPSEPLMSQTEKSAILKRVPRTVWNEIDRELGDRKKIAAIRRFRQATGLGLKVSKEIIDARARDRGLGR